ncbi:MAG: 4-hydroxythreonine-4-phosphate dehydrogenase PdxA [Firmicutes bacterium]|nr:4-hydroxythreonine-4-phosphate dehydrogenase PdxA [Bacillota bacterium]
MIAITMGDGNGVGPEILLKSFKQGELAGDFVAVGDYAVLQAANEKLGYGVKMNRLVVADPQKAVEEDVRRVIEGVQPGVLNVADLGLLTAEDVTPGQISAKVAAASRQYVVWASEAAYLKLFSAVCTLPVNKEAIRLTDPGFTGHTELIAEICHETRYTMMLASKALTVTHVSTHVSMEQSVHNCRKERVLEVIELTQDALGRFLDRPRIAVAGLNPHAGENGAFGRQEIEEIAPAVEEARARGMEVTGPVPPDTVFLRAYRGEFDAVVCMYHDQGHIPMKLLDFEGGVNVTLGLSVMRTSVDHGTAYDIAWKGIAKTGSLAAAYDYAVKMQAR